MAVSTLRNQLPLTQSRSAHPAVRPAISQSPRDRPQRWLQGKGCIRDRVAITMEWVATVIPLPPLGIVGPITVLVQG